MGRGRGRCGPSDSHGPNLWRETGSTIGCPTRFLCQKALKSPLPLTRSWSQIVVNECDDDGFLLSEIWELIIGCNVQNLALVPTIEYWSETWWEVHMEVQFENKHRKSIPNRTITSIEVQFENMWLMGGVESFLCDLYATKWISIETVNFFFWPT